MTIRLFELIKRANALTVKIQDLEDCQKRPGGSWIHPAKIVFLKAVRESVLIEIEAERERALYAALDMRQVEVRIA
jgi:hypothetical protein